MTGERILVVDDGADMRDFVINYVLKPNGYDYLEARDGQEGFETLVSQEPDLVLLDLQMPRLDGIGLLRKMNEQGITTPVVLMTFYGSEDIAIEVFRLGVRDYVQKPFTDEELLEAIERALVETRLRREREELIEKLAAVNQDLERRVREFQSLHEVGRLVSSSSDVNMLMLGIAEATAHITNVKLVYLATLVTGGDVLINRAVARDGKVQLINERSENPAAWQAIQTKQSVVSAPEFDPVSNTFLVHLSAPITIRNKPIGALSIVTQAELATDQQLSLLGILADYVAIGLKGHGWQP